MAPPSFDSIHAPASLARHHEREEKADGPRESRAGDANDRNVRTYEKERQGLDRVSHFRKGGPKPVLYLPSDKPRESSRSCH